MLVSYGNLASGFVLYLAHGRFRYEYNAAGQPVRADLQIPTDTDRLELGFEFEMGEKRRGRGRLTVGSSTGDWFDFPRVLSFLALSGMDIGRDGLSPVSNAYEPPFSFRGTIERVTFVMGERHGTERVLDD